jgi:uncharacterized protein
MTRDIKKVNRTTKTKLVLLLAGVALLAACAGSTPPTPPPTATQMAVEPAAAPNTSTPVLSTATPTETPAPSRSPTPASPLSIESMRARTYPGSDITIEQTLAPGSNYKRYIASYLSDGLKIYALLTVPNGPAPKTGFPAIIFNHGFIPPAQYRTTERYVNYVDAIARSGYIVCKSDYRGHGNSQGRATGGYGSPDYTVDVLNALAAVKKWQNVDPNRIGMWGHSMGGQVTLRAMVVSKDIRAGVIWSGVVASYPNIISHWRRTAPSEPVPTETRHWREELIAQYGTPEQNPAFWDSISPNTYLQDLSGPLQLHASKTDPEVPYAFSQELDQETVAAGKTVEFFTYSNDDHNLSKNFTAAMERTVAFFDKYVKK